MTKKQYAYIAIGAAALAVLVIIFFVAGRAGDGEIKTPPSPSVSSETQNSAPETPNAVPSEPPAPSDEPQPTDSQSPGVQPTDSAEAPDASVPSNEPADGVITDPDKPADQQQKVSESGNDGEKKDGKDDKTSPPMTKVYSANLEPLTSSGAYSLELKGSDPTITLIKIGGTVYPIRNDDVSLMVGTEYGTPRLSKSTCTKAYIEKNGKCDFVTYRLYIPTQRTIDTKPGAPAVKSVRLDVLPNGTVKER